MSQELIAKESVMSHTPGPWEYRPQQYDDWGWVRGPADAKGFKHLVALARSGGQESVEMFDAHRKAKTDPYESNARLIAAAPDMLQSLIELVEEFRHNEHNNCGCVSCKRLKKARAVVSAVLANERSHADD